jgi:hypothetical protein
LVDTYNLDVIIGTQSWLREEINNAEPHGVISIKYRIILPEDGS